MAADRPAKGGGAGAGGGGRPHHRRRSSEGTNASGLDCLLATAAMLASQDSGPPEESASGLAWRIKRQESVKAGRQLNAAIDREVEAHQKGKPGPTGSMHVTGAQNPALVRDDGRTIEPELVTELATVRERRKVRDLKTRKLLGISEAEHEAALEPRVRVAPYSRRVWAMDRDLARLQHKRTGEFVAAWARAFAAYAAGRWAEARPLLKAALRLSNDEDGPANFLLKVIADHGGVAPEGWAGFRVVS